MNHLPKLDYAINQYPQVPCLCKRRYDGLDFYTYPDRCGFNSSQVKSGVFLDHAETEVASFLQTWLYFGILHELFNPHRTVTIEDFVEVKDNAWVISTAKLDEYLNALLVGMRGIEVVILPAEAERLNSLQDHLLSMTQVLCAQENCPLPNEVILSFSVLGLTMDCFYKEWLHLPIVRDWGLLDLATSQMAQAGWCPRDLHMLETTCTELTIYYMSHLKRDFYPQEHAMCSKQKCQANQLDKNRYVTKHLIKGCRCRHMGPDVEEVKKIIRAGNIPVVNLMPNNWPNDSYDLDLSVKEVKSLAQSRALMRVRIVSHVWSDGLGNPTANTLPLCQLKFLFQCLKGSWWAGVMLQEEHSTDPKLQYEAKLGWYIDPSEFSSNERDGKKSMSLTIFNRLAKTQAGLNLWIDTLCVPNGDDACRRMAIENMDKVYGAATAAMVLDSELQHRSVKEERVELLARVALCGWMRRAWTYQEGVMAWEGPMIKFADGIIGLNQLLLTDFGRNLEGTSSGEYAFAPNISRFNNFLAQKFPSWGYETPEQKTWKETLAQLRSFWNTENFIYFDLITLFSDIRSVKVSSAKEPGKGDRAKRIKSVWNALQWRNTTRLGDKFVIFNLSCCMTPKELKTVSKRVLSHSIVHPMVIWLSHQHEIPEGLVFVKGPRLQAPNPTWAPSDLHPHTIKGDGFIERPIISGPLEFRKPGLLLLDEDPLIYPRYFLHEISIDTIFLLTLDEESTDRRHVTIPGGTALAVIMLEIPWLYKEAPAILVQVTQVSDNGWRAFFRSCGEIRRTHYGEAARGGAAVWSAQGIGPEHLWKLD